MSRSRCHRSAVQRGAGLRVGIYTACRIRFHDRIREQTRARVVRVRVRECDRVNVGVGVGAARLAAGGVAHDPVAEVVHGAAPH